MDSGWSPETAELEPAPVPVEEKTRSRKFTDILNEIATDATRERVSVGDLLAAMGDRAFGALMFIFAFPNVLPTPPGTSTLLGTPLVFLAAQLAFGRQPWLPRLIANRSMTRADFAGLIAKALPWLEKGEKLLRPRWRLLVVPPAEYLVGAMCLVLATVLVLPIPLGNILPAFAICLFSLGILERDGLWVILGAVASVVSLVIAGGVVYAFLKAAIFVFTNAFA